MAAYEPISASAYIKTPKILELKHCIVNVNNEYDSKCFIWSVLAALHQQKLNANRVAKYVRYEKELNVAGLEFPLQVNQVKRFEQLNESISINVFAYDNRTGPYPLYVTNKKCQHHINLLLLTEGEKRHYAWIKIFSSFVRRPGQHKARKYYCNYCLHGFCRQDILDRHVVDCSVLGCQKVRMPDHERRWLRFKAIQKMLPVPFVIYADIESYTTKIEGPMKNPSDSSTHPYELHTPSGFAYLIVCSDPSRVYQPVVYRGHDVINELLRRLREESNRIYDTLKDVVPMELTKDEERQFKEADKCYLCSLKLGNDRVRDHNHLTGCFRGAVHNDCNLKLQYRADKRNRAFYIPVIFHNLRGYDGHFLIKEYNNESRVKETVSCIPTNTQSYMSVSIGQLRFIDSLQFTNASLDKLSSTLNKTDEFTHTRRHMPDDKVHLMLRKGVFCYDYWDSPEKANETNLPSRDKFFSRLTQEDITVEDYEHANVVWNAFQLQNLGEYHDLYLKTDVLILADVFEAFRKMCLTYYKLDAAHFYSAPGLAWESMLKMTDVSLELLT